MSIIQLRSGLFFDLSRPNPALIRLDDIAWSLAGIGRYNSHADRHVSVAEHCVHVSLLCHPDDAREGLFHDGAEGYVGDVPSPLKVLLLPAFETIELGVTGAIRERFDLPRRMSWPASVRAADLRMLAIEARLCMSPHAKDARIHWGDLLNANDDRFADDPRIERIGRPPAEARKFFLDRCEELGVR